VREYVDGNSLLSYTFDVCWRNRRHVGKKNIYFYEKSQRRLFKNEARPILQEWNMSIRKRQVRLISPAKS